MLYLLLLYFDTLTAGAAAPGCTCLLYTSFSVRIAPDGGTALQEFAKAAPDLILLDVMLPVLDGWSVLSRVREASRVPVIMLSLIHISAPTDAPLATPNTSGEASGSENTV